MVAILLQQGVMVESVEHTDNVVVCAGLSPTVMDLRGHVDYRTRQGGYSKLFLNRVKRHLIE